MILALMTLGAVCFAFGYVSADLAAKLWNRRR